MRLKQSCPIRPNPNPNPNPTTLIIGHDILTDSHLPSHQPLPLPLLSCLCSSLLK